MAQSVHPIRGGREELQILDHDPAYRVDISSDYQGLPKKYGDHDIEWIFRFDLKAGNPKPENKKYKVKLSKSQPGVEYVLYIEDKTGGTIVVLEQGKEKDLTAGDPAVGISH